MAVAARELRFLDDAPARQGPVAELFALEPMARDGVVAAVADVVFFFRLRHFASVDARAASECGYMGLASAVVLFRSEAKCEVSWGEETC